VQIVWRADIEEARDLAPAMKEGRQGDTCSRLIDLFKLVPTRSAEAIEVPLWAARAWLDKAAADPAGFSDAPERGKDTDDPASPARRRAFRWAGEDSGRTEVVYASRLRNGDLIVVPAAYGGCDEWGWHPTSDVEADECARVPVVDVAEEAAWPYRFRRLAVRITPELIEQEMGQGDGLSELVAQFRDMLADREEEKAAPLLDAVLALRLPPTLKSRLELLRHGRRGSLERSFAYDDAQRGVVFFAPRGLDGKEGEPAATPSTESEPLGAASERPLGLAAHCGHVMAWADDFAARAGLVPTLAADVTLAARLHDLGKADRRYQAWFAGGDPFGADASEPLAKTGQRRLPRDAWRQAELPDSWRHEALSVRAAIAHPALEGASDPLLVLWLIGTHHGHGRPLFPHADPQDVASRPLLLPLALGGELQLKDTERGPQSLAFDFDGLDWAQIFEALKERYGIWGLARLEAFVRLADHRASEAGAAPAASHGCREAAE
jgi:CRISPR-associated endonuclease/helicase Cas3